MSNQSASGAERLLPEPFNDLEALARIWALPTATGRSEQRSRSTLAEMKLLHDAVIGRIEDIFKYLDQHPLDALPEDAKRLLQLTLSLAEVTPSIHFYKEERPGHIVDPRRIEFWPVQNMTPSI